MRPSPRPRAPSILAPLLALLAVAGCHRTPDTVMADRAWVRLPAVAGNPAAAYFTVTGGPAADRLLTVASPAAARIELHAAGMTAGAMTMAMTPLAGVDVPAGGSVGFAPGGNHAMLFGLSPTLAPGTPLPLTLRFRSGTVVTVPARAVAAGDEAPF